MSLRYLGHLHVPSAHRLLVTDVKPGIDVQAVNADSALPWPEVT